MCGIAGIYIKDPSLVKSHEGLEEFMDLLFDGIENRGRKATGFVAVSADGTVRMDKAPVTASEFIKTRERLPLDCRYILLHTRLDTQGSPADFRNNHPVIHKTCFSVHNGWVRNDDTLYEKYGLDRHGEVDSEIIAALMWESNFDIEKMKEAFDEMQGSIACATIDPIRHPGKVILARTESSPLVLIDTPKFVVWASEKKAIQEAWGKKLGTPPGDKKFEDVKRNTLLVVSSDGINRHEIPDTHKTVYETRPHLYGLGQRYVGGTPYVPPTQPTTTKKTSTWSGSGSYTPIVLTKDIREVVEAMRSRDIGVAKLWNGKHKMEFSEQLGPWSMCTICVDRVHDDDMRNSMRGKMCVDCYAAWMQLAASARSGVGGVNKVVKASDFKDVNKQFTEDQIDKFNSWANDEDFVHGMCLRELALQTNFTEEALEFLLFRLTSEDEKKVDGLREWRIDMMMLYDAEYDDNWQMYDNDGDGIGIAILEDEPAPVVQLALPPAPVEEVKVRFTPTAGVNKKCSCCRRKVKVVVERVQTHEHLGYCNRHFARCDFIGCKEKPNHISEFGRRLCHAHARGKEAYATVQLEKEGFIVRSGG